MSKYLFLMNPFLISWKISFPIKPKFFNNQDPPWINSKMKTMIQEKSKIYLKLHLKNRSNILGIKFETLQNLIYESLENCKNRCNENISKKIGSKVTPLYWKC